MRYIKVFMARGGSQNLRRQEGGVTRKPIFAYQGGGGVKKPENPAYIVYGWTLIKNARSTLTFHNSCASEVEVHTVPYFKAPVNGKL